MVHSIHSLLLWAYWGQMLGWIQFQISGGSKEAKQWLWEPIQCLENAGLSDRLTSGDCNERIWSSFQSNQFRRLYPWISRKGWRQVSWEGGEGRSWRRRKTVSIQSKANQLVKIKPPCLSQKVMHMDIQERAIKKKNTEKCDKTKSEWEGGSSEKWETKSWHVHNWFSKLKETTLNSGFRTKKRETSNIIMLEKKQSCFGPKSRQPKGSLLVQEQWPDPMRWRFSQAELAYSL